MSSEQFRGAILALLSLSFSFLIATLIYVFKEFKNDFHAFRKETNGTLSDMNESITQLNLKVTEVITQGNTHKEEIAILREKTDTLALEQAKLMGK